MKPFHLISQYSILAFILCLTFLQLPTSVASDINSSAGATQESSLATNFVLEEDEVQQLMMPLKKKLQTRKGKSGIYSLSNPEHVYEVINAVELENGKMAYQVIVGPKQRWIVDDDVILYDENRNQIGASAKNPKYIQTTEVVALLKEPVSEVESPDLYTASFDASIPNPLFHRTGGLPLPTSPVILDTRSAKPAFAKACTEFIRDDRSYGTWGEHIFNRLSPNTHPALFGQIQDLPQLCPKFNSMDVVQKKQFWIYVFAAMAFKESSCNYRITAVGKNDTAAGLLQLPMNRSMLNAQRCSNVNPLNAQDNLTCSLTILNRNIETNGKLFYNSAAGERGYWQVLQTDKDGDGVRMRMRMYTPCF